jgi:hypothetical protein
VGGHLEALDLDGVDLALRHALGERGREDRLIATLGEIRKLAGQRGDRAPPDWPRPRRGGYVHLRAERPQRWVNRVPKGEERDLVLCREGAQ